MASHAKRGSKKQTTGTSEADLKKHSRIARGSESRDRRDSDSERGKHTREKGFVGGDKRSKERRGGNMKKAPVERGPTKREMREEEENKRTKRQDKSASKPEAKKDKDAVKKGDSKKGDLKKDAVKKIESKNDAAKKDIRTKDSAKKDIRTKDSAKNDAAKKDSAKKDVTKKDSAKKDVTKTPELKNLENTTPNSSPAPKTGKPFKAKPKGKHSGKILYTEQNINAFLLDSKRTAAKDTQFTMLLFVFKQFKTRPEELLSKIKILTSEKKVEVKEDDTIQEVALRHLFANFGLKGELLENLFSMLAADSLVAKYAADFLFSTPFEISKYDYYFNGVCDELAKTVERATVMTMKEYLALVGEIDECESVQKYAFDAVENPDGRAAKEGSDEKDSPDEKESSDAKESPDAQESPEETAQPPSSSAAKPPSSSAAPDAEKEDSSFSLVSLNDDAEIERLDKQLGSLFKRKMLSVSEEEYAVNLISCLEILVKHNYAVKAENLIKILYFGQFSLISKTVKFIVRDLLQKVSDPERVFKIYQMCALAVPENYQFFNTFATHCGGTFDLRKFLGPALSFGHEDQLVNRVSLEKFSGIYDSTLGDAFDEFFLAILQNENNLEIVQSLDSQDFKSEIKSAIDESVKKLTERKAKKATPSHD